MKSTPKVDRLVANICKKKQDDTEVQKSIELFYLDTTTSRSGERNLKENNTSSYQPRSPTINETEEHDAIGTGGPKIQSQI